LCTVMAACVAVKDRTWTELPMKIELGSSGPFSSPRLRAWSALDEVTKVGQVCGGGIRRPTGGLVDAEQIRHRLRTNSSIGLPATPYAPTFGPTTEEEPCKADVEIDLRSRFRTESFVGMPISPWSPFDGMGMGVSSVGCLEAVAGVPFAAQPILPENRPSPQMPPSLPSYRGFSPHSGLAQVPTQEIKLSALLDSPPMPATNMRPVPTPPSLTNQRTSVMLRNLPSGFSCRQLLNLLDSLGFVGRYDFVYQPVNFETMTCLSHAFVNMVSPADAERLREQLEGFSDWAVPSESVCQVVWNDKHQGLAALVDRYRNSPVMHPDIPEECKPILLSAGRRIQFPPPTQRVKSPKFCRSKV